ncbi:membrane protein insertase YidC [Bacillus sp. SL00103]
MALLKPQIDDIQSKLKKTKEPEKQKELQMEMMKVYKENNVNPLAMGCLPMLIQIPIVLGFYSAIRSTPEIATHSFLWFNLGQRIYWSRSSQVLCIFAILCYAKIYGAIST